MITRRAFTVALAIFVASAVSPLAFGAPKSSAAKLTATWLTDNTVTPYGVFNDKLSNLYANGVSGVQCYFGVSGKNLVLVTYNTPRTLHYVFNTTQTAWQASGIPSDLYAVSDFYGVNYFGPYASQGLYTTAQVSASLEFYVGTVTYELNYPALASYRVSSSTWLITSDPNDPLLPGGYPGFTATDTADLVVVRRKSNTTFGSVNMPIRFEVTLQ
ncbi:MAG: hypothetical protein ACM3NO_07940 [Deltaproteobacteria bacterium]